MGNKSDELLQDVVKKLGIGSYKRHIFLCTGPKCCSEKEGADVWDYLKMRSKELNAEGIAVYRSKVGCLRVCQQGPIALVYPEGTWYRNVSKKNCEQIIQEHLINGRPVDSLAIATNKL